MAASVSGAKTTTVSVAPHLTTSTINTILGTALENMTLTQFYQVVDYLERVNKGSEKYSSTTIGSLMT